MANVVNPNIISLAELIWENEPISYEKLVQKCVEEFSWSKPKAYRILHKLCKSRIAQKNDGIVSSIATKEECWAKWSKQYGNESYHGAVQDYLDATTRVGFFESGSDTHSKRYN